MSSHDSFMEIVENDPPVEINEIGIENQRSNDMLDERESDNKFVENLRVLFSSKTVSLNVLKQIEDILNKPGLNNKLKKDVDVWQSFQEFVTRKVHVNQPDQYDNVSLYFVDLSILFYCFGNIIVKHFKNEQMLREVFENFIDKMIDFEKMRVGEYGYIENSPVLLNQFYMTIINLANNTENANLIKNMVNDKLIIYVTNEIETQLEQYLDNKIGAVIFSIQNIFDDMQKWDTSLSSDKTRSYKIKYDELVKFINVWETKDIVLDGYLQHISNIGNAIEAYDVPYLRDKMLELHTLLLICNENIFFKNLRQKTQNIQGIIDNVGKCLEMLIQLNDEKLKLDMSLQHLPNVRHQTIYELDEAKQLLVNQKNTIEIEGQIIFENLFNINPDNLKRNWLLMIKELLLQYIKQFEVPIDPNLADNLTHNFRYKHFLFKLFSQNHLLFKANNINTRFAFVFEIKFNLGHMINVNNVYYDKCLKDLNTGYTYDLLPYGDNFGELTLQINNDIFVFTLNADTMFYEKTPQQVSLAGSLNKIIIYDEHFVNAEEIYKRVMLYNKQLMALCYNKKDKDRIHLRNVIYIDGIGDKSRLILGFIFIDNNAEIVCILWCDRIQPVNMSASQTLMVLLPIFMDSTQMLSYEPNYELHINRFTLKKYNSKGLARIITAIFTNIISITKIYGNPVRRVISEAINPISVWLLVYYFKWKMLPIQNTNDLEYLLDNQNNINLNGLNVNEFVQNKWHNQNIDETNRDEFQLDLGTQYKTSYGNNALRVFMQSFVSEEDVARAKQIEDAYFKEKQDMFCDLLKTGEEFYNVASIEEDLGNFGGRRWKQNSKKYRKTKATKVNRQKKQKIHLATKQKKQKSMKQHW